MMDGIREKNRFQGDSTPVRGCLTAFCSLTRNMKAQHRPRTWRSGVKLPDPDSRTILGTKNHFLPVLEHRLLSEGSGENASTHRTWDNIDNFVQKVSRREGWSGSFKQEQDPVVSA